MIRNRMHLAVLTSCALGLLCAGSASAATAWQGETFLSDYSKLVPAPGGKEGKDFTFVAKDVEQRAARYTKVMIDQPEVFISPESPYKGAKPEDILAISDLVRTSTTDALKERGYLIVDKPGADTLYLRLAVTDLQMVAKKRGLLSYTPVGLVVNAGMKALQDFMDKYDLLDMALQVEIQDSANSEVLAAAVLKRGKGADASKPIKFDVLVAASDLLGERLACRLDNAKVPAAQRIDCTDPAARAARPTIVGK